MTLIRNQKGSIKNEKCSFEGTVIENVTSQFSKQQLIKEATHMVDNYSCIILIFTPQTNLAIELGVEPSLHWNYYHQIIYLKFYLEIFNTPPYLHKVWHYKNAKAEFTRQSIAFFDWEKVLWKTSVDGKVAIFNRSILNIFNNFIPHETIWCNDRAPTWLNDKIRLLIKEKKDGIHI